MRHSLSVPILFVGLIVWTTGISISSAVLAIETNELRDIQHEAEAAALMEMIDSVLEHHVAPATRQQLILETVQHLAGAQLYNTTGWAKEISNAQSNEQLKAILAAGIAEHAPYAESQAVPFALSQRWERLTAALRFRGIAVSPVEEAAVRQQLAANRYVGIGIAAQQNDDQLLISKVIPGGPAEQGGLKDGDHIVRIDTYESRKHTLPENIAWLRGPEGSQVKLRISREPFNDEDQFEVTLTRGVVPIATIQETELSKSGRTAVIKVEQLLISTTHELRRAVDTLPSTVSHVILDFRGTVGTDLHSAVVLGDALFDAVPLGYQIDAAGHETAYEAEPGRMTGDRHVGFLIGDSLSGPPLWLVAAAKQTNAAAVYGFPVQGNGVALTSHELNVAPFALQMATSMLLPPDRSPLIARNQVSPQAHQEAADSQRKLREAEPRKSYATGYPYGGGAVNNTESTAQVDELTATLTPHFRFYGSTAGELEKFIDNTHSDKFLQRESSANQ